MENSNKSKMIIFLDIDGVLVSYLSLKDRDPVDYEHCFKLEAVESLNEITDLYDAKIVISSSWRVGSSKEELTKIFERRKVKAEIIDVTGYADSWDRGDEIQEWLDNNDYLGQYIIIDDEVSDIVNYHKHVLKTNRYRCLDKYDVIELKRNQHKINKTW